MNDTRVQIHWAAQAVAGVGRTHLPPKPDDSHTNFAWSRPHRALVQAPHVEGERAGLRLADLTLLLVRGDEVADSLPLTGRTLDDAFRFFEERLGGPLLQRPCEGLPEHALSRGVAFATEAADLARFDRLYDEADARFQVFAASHTNASPVRCWPHHLDIASLVSLGEEQTIGAGFVPGDAQFPEPYWYVTPWPRPSEDASFAPLENGSWNREGWFGAVMQVGKGDIAQFLDEAYARLA